MKLQTINLINQLGLIRFKEIKYLAKLKLIDLNTESKKQVEETKKDIFKISKDYNHSFFKLLKEIKQEIREEVVEEIKQEIVEEAVEENKNYIVDTAIKLLSRIEKLEKLEKKEVPSFNLKEYISDISYTKSLLKILLVYPFDFIFDLIGDNINTIIKEETCSNIYKFFLHLPYAFSIILSLITTIIIFYNIFNIAFKIFYSLFNNDK